MSRATAFDRIRNAKPGDAGAKTLGRLGRQVGSAYDQASATAEQAYEEAQAAYHDAIHTAEQAYGEARAAAEEAYDEAQHRAEAVAAQSSRLYNVAVKRGQAYGERAVKFTGDNKALALLLAGGVGFLLAVSLKKK